jgi:NADH-quinone oxidoreductase subunit E
MYIDEKELSPRRPQGGHPDVVVIDDDESLCEGCRQTLEMGGYRAAVARNGKDGLEMVKRERPSVVLVDLKMPGLSGEEVLARLPTIDSTVVSIVITGYGTIETAVESMRTGAFDFLSKPFEPERLVETVRRAIQESHQRRDSEAVETPAAPEALPVNRQSVVLKGLEALGDFYALGLEKGAFLDELKYLEAEAKYHSESLGQIQQKEKAIRDVVCDLRTVDEIIARHEYRKSALLQILLDVQTQLRWLPRHVLKWVSTRLGVPLARTYSIATFYEAFSLKPRGKHLVQLCTGTACHVRGANELVAKVCTVLGIQPGETDPKQLFTLTTVHCMGCCALAPVMKIDDHYYSNPKADDLKKIISAYEQQEQASWQN